jgi:hypothetical protein
MAIRRCTLRSALPVLVLASALALSACSGGADAESQGPPTGPASASSTATPTPTADSRPTPASSTGPARNLPRPQLPAAAKENTKAGFEAFTQYWFDTVTYALETGDTGPLRAVSKPDCKICNGFAEEAQKSNSDGKWTVPTKWTVRSFHSDLKLDPLGQARGLFLADETASTDFHADGSVATARPAQRDETARDIYAIHDGKGWRVSQAGTAA